MQKTVKTKAAGAGTEQNSDPGAEVLRPINDGPIASAGEPDATPPDIIIE